MAALTVPAGSIEEQIIQTAGKLHLHIINFTLALLIAPALLRMLFLLSRSLVLDLNKFVSFAVLFFYTAYLILISLSYGSQITLLPFLIRSGTESQVLRWFFYNDESLAILINQWAYLFWSLATILLFIPALKTKEILLRIIIFILLISSFLQIFATLGLLLKRSSLTGLSFISGVLLLPASLLILIRSILKRRNRKR